MPPRITLPNLATNISALDGLATSSRSCTASTSGTPREVRAVPIAAWKVEDDDHLPHCSHPDRLVSRSGS
eukprot:scaffold6322_cov59-Cylindrotheca_fusiformis.AAC.16